MIHSFLQFDFSFTPQRLVWFAGGETAGSSPEQPGSSAVAFDLTDADDAAKLADVADALPSDQAAAVRAAANPADTPTEQSDRTREKPKSTPEIKNVPSPLVELVEAGLIKTPCNTASINEVLDDSHAQLTSDQRTFLETILKRGDAGITTLNKQLEEYQNIKDAFRGDRMRAIVERSHENVVEHAYATAGDFIGKGLRILDKGMDKHPYGMLVAGAALLYLAVTNRDKIGSLWKWGLGITGAAIVAPMAIDALKVVPHVDDHLGPANAAAKETAEKKAKIDFLTGNLPPSFIATLRKEDKKSDIQGDERLLGFYELCQMSVAQFVDEMLKQDGDLSDAEVGINLGNQMHTLTAKQRYYFGKELISKFGFNPDDRASLLAFKEQFGKNEQKLWMAAKVFPTTEKPTEESAS